MNQSAVLLDLGYILAAAAGAGLLARRIRVPLLVAYMVAGLILGPVTAAVDVGEAVDLISHTGIALLLFLVGLEMSIGAVRDVGRVAVLAGGGQAVVTAGAAWVVASLLGFTGAEAAIIALAMTFSSTVVAITLLEQLGDLGRTYGRLTVGILLVQDLIAVTALTLLAGAAESGAATSAAGVARGVGVAVVGVTILVAIALGLARVGLPRLFGWMTRSPDSLLVWSLALCFAFMIAAEHMGLSVEMGAFVAGVGLAQLPQSHELRRRVHPLASFFLAVFFVTLGIRMAPAEALALPGAVLAFAGLALLFKPAVLAGLLPRFRLGQRSSFLAALSLAQISEFSFILADVGQRAGLIGTDVFSVIGVVGMLTIGISAFAIENGAVLYERAATTGVLRWMRAAPEPADRSDARSGHVIVVGMNSLGRLLVTGLVERGERVLAIDSDPAKLAGLPSETLTGNAEHPGLLEEADLSAAKLFVSALQIEDANNLFAHRCREAGVPCGIHAFDPSTVPDLRSIGVDYLMVSRHDGIRQVAQAMREAGVID